MTISSEVRKAGPFSGNGSATSFPFDFKIFSSSDLAVYLTDPSGAESVLGGSDYTAHMNADQESAPGGTVVKTTPLAAGYALTITSKLPYLQPVRLTNQGGFYPEVINTALDRLTVFAQQLDEQVGRAVKSKISDTVTPEQLLDGIKADTAAAKGAAAAAAGSASAASASESAAAGHVQTAQAAASNAQQQAQAAHGSAEVASQALETIVNVGGITLGNSLPLGDGAASAGSSTSGSRQDHRHPTDTTRAPLASPALTGTPTAPTATAGTNTTQIATTEFVRLSSPATLATNGVQVLPSGLIIQWGTATSNASGDFSITLPVAFPTAGLRAIISEGASGAWASNMAIVHGVNSLSNTTLTAKVRAIVGTGGPAPASSLVGAWIAIGY